MEFAVQIKQPQIEISDNTIMPALRNAQIETENVTACHFILAVDRIPVIIHDYTLAETVFIEGFSDCESHITIFKSDKTKIHIVGQTMIDIMQINSESALIAESEIGEFTIGIPLDFNKEPRGNNIPDVGNLDIRDCIIKSIRTEAVIKNVNIQGTSINNFICGSFFDVAKSTDRLHIWQNTEIKALELFAKFNNFIIENSKIENIYAQGNGLINGLIIKNSIVENSFGFTEKYFDKSVDSIEKWSLIEKSAQTLSDTELKALANYKIICKRMDGLPMHKKLPQYLLKWSTGFGYKPFRIFPFSIIVILLCAILFAINSTFNSVNPLIWVNVNCVINNAQSCLLDSFSAFVGINDFTINGGFHKVIVMIENMLGVISFALFANALYIKYAK